MGGALTFGLIWSSFKYKKNGQKSNINNKTEAVSNQNIYWYNKLNVQLVDSTDSSNVIVARGCGTAGQYLPGRIAKWKKNPYLSLEKPQKRLFLWSDQ